MRGRLIYPFLAQVFRRATSSTDPGEVAFDPDFKEPVRVDRDGDGLAERARSELAPVLIPCQVEPETFEQLRMLPSGLAPDSRIDLVLHYRDLQRLGMVQPATGLPRLGAGDRLGGLFDRDERPVQLVRDPPGLFLIEARAAGFGLGLGRPSRNLLMVTFASRAVATPGGAG